VTEALYVPHGERFVPTGWTRGPWSADAQHAGPPAALLGRAFEALEPAEGFRVARLTVEILRPIPMAPLRVAAEAVLTRRRVQFATATLHDDDGEVARAGAWRIRASEQQLPDVGLGPVEVPLPEESADGTWWQPRWRPSYFDAMEWRLAAGAVLEPGPAAVWMRMRVPLVAGEEPSPLTRVLVVADSANGISWELGFDGFLFVNTELTVHLVRLPAGEWVCLDARTRIDPEGVGLAQSVLWDERGRLGAGAQSLLVAPRRV
jgi:hypothetical protein